MRFKILLDTVLKIAFLLLEFRTAWIIQYVETFITKRLYMSHVAQVPLSSNYIQAMELGHCLDTCFKLVCQIMYTSHQSIFHTSLLYCLKLHNSINSYTGVLTMHLGRRIFPGMGGYDCFSVNRQTVHCMCFQSSKTLSINYYMKQSFIFFLQITD